MRPLALALLWVMACTGQAVPTRPLPLTAALFTVARQWRAPRRASEDDFARAELDDIAQRVKQERLRNSQLTAGAALGRVVFETLGFEREVDDDALEYVLLPNVLRNRRGSCVGLGSLYLALGERLGWSIQGVLVPSHFFVRIAEPGEPNNLELLRRGEVMPDSWYVDRFPVPGGSAPAYRRGLRPNEVVGVIEYNIGNQRKRAGRLRDAQRAYARARGHFPDFAEAHASAGALAQLMGALTTANEAYRAAKQAHPHLPGLDENLALLEAELAYVPTPRH
jgi:tetratricopeptide (TPR) repeat protein